MLIGLAVLIGRFHLQPVEGVTVLAQLADASLGHGFGFYLVQFATVILLALAANTSFGGLPVLMRLLARDNHLPHVFALRADHQVHRHGVLFLAVVSAGLLVASGGDVNSLVPLFSIGVFVGFTICQVGMVKHWFLERGAGWRGRAALNGFGALLTGVATLVVTGTKFTEGAWGIVVALPLLVLLFELVHRAYGRIGERLELGRVPGPVTRQRSLVVVPVTVISRLTREALSTAVSLGDEVLAVTVVPTEPDAEDRQSVEALRRDWELWQPGVPLIEVRDEHRRLGLLAGRIRQRDGLPGARQGRRGRLRGLRRLRPHHRADRGGRAGALLAAGAAEPARCADRPRAAPGHRRGGLPAAAADVAVRPPEADKRPTGPPSGASRQRGIPRRRLRL